MSKSVKITVISLITLCLVLVCSLVGCVFLLGGANFGNEPIFEANSPRPEGGNFVYQDIISRTYSSVVCIKASSSTSASNGSGFIISEEGLIATNQHVVKGYTKDISVTLTDSLGKTFTYKATRVDRPYGNTDLALLQITNGGDTKFPALKFADSDAVTFGNACVMIGNPKGIGLMTARAMVGNPSVKISDYADKLIAIDAPVNPGNSGGPIINANCEVIGVITFRHSSDGSANKDVIFDIGYAIKANDAVDFFQGYSAVSSTGLLSYHKLVADK